MQLVRERRDHFATLRDNLQRRTAVSGQVQPSAVTCSPCCESSCCERVCVPKPACRKSASACKERAERGLLQARRHVGPTRSSCMPCKREHWSSTCTCRSDCRAVHPLATKTDHVQKILIFFSSDFTLGPNKVAYIYSIHSPPSACAAHYTARTPFKGIASCADRGPLGLPASEEFDLTGSVSFQSGLSSRKTPFHLSPDLTHPRTRLPTMRSGFVWSALAAVALAPAATLGGYVKVDPYNPPAKTEDGQIG